MAGYVKGTLLKDERIVYRGHVSIWLLSGLIVVGIVFFLLGFGSRLWWALAIVCWAVAFIRYQTTELAVTNKRVVAKWGFISRRTIELNIKNVETIQVSQGILGRIFNYGTLLVAGGGNPMERMPGISRPLEFRRACLATQETAK